MSKERTKRNRHMMYVQQMDYLPAKTMDNLLDEIEKKVKPVKYAAILHDKDVDENGQLENPHIHVMLSFENARSINNVAKQLNEKVQYIEAWNGDGKNGYAYLIHATDKARLKHQYDVSEVKANFDYVSMIQAMSKEVAQTDKFGDSAKIKNLLNMLYTGTVTKEEVEKQLTGSQYAKARKQIEDVWAKRLQNLAVEWRKEMKQSGKPIKVIWIYGAAGTGKTSLAKEYAQKTGQPFYISGSSRDVFQWYSGEHTLILDELRPRQIPYSDLLRITDPFGMESPVMAPSRYSDKALSCDLIIITSPYDPYSFYTKIFGKRNTNMVDSFHQLERRITISVEMTSTEIFLAKYNGFFFYYEPDIASRRPNPYSAVSRPVNTSNADDIYNDLFN